jgi:hypothetical protein
MRRDYDVFEKFFDGSTLWRVCVQGRHEAQRKMQEFKEHSENDFFAIDVQAAELLPPRVMSGSRPQAKAMAAIR